MLQTQISGEHRVKEREWLTAASIIHMGCERSQPTTEVTDQITTSPKVPVETLYCQKGDFVQHLNVICMTSSNSQQKQL